MGKSKKSRYNTNINFWAMLRDVLIASMNKGQFPFVSLMGIFALMVFRMPPADISKLIFDIFDKFERGYYVGYGLSVVFVIGWFVHVKAQRRVIAREMERIAEERNRYQRGQLGNDLGSSENQ